MVDTLGPAVTVPDDIVAEATGASGAAVTFTVTATDVVDGTRTVNCTAASGSTFPLGTTTVQCTSTDTRGNAGRNSFDVTVRAVDLFGKKTEIGSVDFYTQNANPTP